MKHPQIHIKPKPSKQLLGLLLGLHILAVVAIWQANMSVASKAVCYGALLFFACCSIGYHRSRRIVCCWYQAGQWLIQDRQGTLVSARLGRCGVVSTQVIILYFYMNTPALIGYHPRRRCLLLTKDSLPLETFRQLRVLLFTNCMFTFGNDIRHHTITGNIDRRS